MNNKSNGNIQVLYGSITMYDSNGKPRVRIDTSGSRVIKTETRIFHLDNVLRYRKLRPAEILEALGV